MKKAITGFLAATMVLAAVLTLAACSGGKSADPNIGVWEAVEIEMMGITLPIEEIDKVLTIELKDRGVATFDIDGTIGDGKWTIDGNTVTFVVEGETFTATIDGDVMVISNWLDTGMTVKFVKQA